METLVVRVEDKETAMLIKKVLEEFRTVIDVNVAKDNYLSKVVADYELREDAKASSKRKS